MSRSNRLPPVSIDLRQLDDQQGYERMPDGRVFQPYNGRFPHVGPLYDGMVYPGNGYPPNPGEDRLALSPFGRLARGQGLGKSSILLYNADDARVQPAAVPMLQLEGDDMDARQLCITLAPPRVIPIAFAEAADGLRSVQNLTGEQTNGQVSAGNFPGDSSPIAWPPLEAIVEWGVRGASSRAVVDYVNGCTLNVVASFVRVYAAVTQLASIGGFAGTSAAYYLSAFVGPGYNNTGTAKNTVFVGEVAAETESDIIEIPKFARKAYLVGCDASTPPTTTDGYLRFWQSPDGTNCVGNMLQSGSEPKAFDVPNGAQYFSVLSGMNVPCLFNVVFELTL